MKKTILSLVLGISLVFAASLDAQVSSTNSAAWSPPVAPLYTNINYNVVASIPSVTASQLGNGTSLPSVGNGVIGAVNTTSTNTPVSSILPTLTTFTGSYVLWIQAVGTSAGVVSSSAWSSLSFTYSAPALPIVQNIHFQ